MGLRTADRGPNVLIIILILIILINPSSTDRQRDDLRASEPPWPDLRAAMDG